jgi:tetratricopeptide (TPR) repeat protein
MKRMVVTGILALAASAAGLMAQAPSSAPPAAKLPKVKSKSEMEAVQAMQAALSDPDKAIAACENVITKFADSEFKNIALTWEAKAYEEKKDFDHMVIFADQALAGDPQNLQAALMLAKYYAENTHENDLDKEEKLGKGETYAKQVIELAKTAPKPNPQLPDADWADIRKDWAAESYNYLGLDAMTRKKYDDAVADFKSAVETNSRPEGAYMVRLASALIGAGKPDEAIIWCDKIIADPNAHPRVKQVAQNFRAQAVRAGGKPAGGAAPEAK